MVPLLCRASSVFRSRFFTKEVNPMVAKFQSCPECGRTLHIVEPRPGRLVPSAACGFTPPDNPGWKLLLLVWCQAIFQGSAKRFGPWRRCSSWPVSPAVSSFSAIPRAPRRPRLPRPLPKPTIQQKSKIRAANFAGSWWRAMTLWPGSNSPMPSQHTRKPSDCFLRMSMPHGVSPLRGPLGPIKKMFLPLIRS